MKEYPLGSQKKAWAFYFLFYFNNNRLVNYKNKKNDSWGCSSSSPRSLQFCDCDIVNPNFFNSRNVPRKTSYSPATLSSMRSFRCSPRRQSTHISQTPPSPAQLHLFQFYPRGGVSFTAQVPIGQGRPLKVRSLGSNPPFLHLPLQVPRSPHAHPVQAL